MPDSRDRFVPCDNEVVRLGTACDAVAAADEAPVMSQVHSVQVQVQVQQVQVLRWQVQVQVLAKFTSTSTSTEFQVQVRVQVLVLPSKVYSNSSKWLALLLICFIL